MGLFSRKKKSRNSGSLSAAPTSESEPTSPGSYRKSQADEQSITSSITSHQNSQGGAPSILDQGLKSDDNSDSGMNAEDKFMQYYQVKQDQSVKSINDSSSVRSSNSNSSALTDQERKDRARAAVEERKRKVSRRQEYPEW